MLLQNGEIVIFQDTDKIRNCGQLGIMNQSAYNVNTSRRNKQQNNKSRQSSRNRRDRN